MLTEHDATERRLYELFGLDSSVSKRGADDELVP